MKRGRFFNRKAWLAIFILFSLIGCRSDVAQQIEDTKQAEAMIEKSPTYKELDDLCSQIPKPGHFELVGKIIPGRGRIVRHEYYLEGDREDIKNFYFKYFTGNGWQTSDIERIAGEAFEFKKDRYEIEISPGYGRGKANYKFSCKFLAGN